MTDTRFFRRIAGVALLLVGIVPASPKADELSWRVVHYLVMYDLKPVGDVEGHVAGPWVRRGLAFFKGGPADGEVAVYKNVGTTDQTKTRVTSVAEGTFTFEDGSSFTTKNTTTTEILPSGQRRAATVIELIKGTGRFAGIEGKGTGTGRQLTPPTGETKGDAYFDVVLTYTLPKSRA